MVQHYRCLLLLFAVTAVCCVLVASYVHPSRNQDSIIRPRFNPYWPVQNNKQFLSVSSKVHMAFQRYAGGRQKCRSADASSSPSVMLCTGQQIHLSLAAFFFFGNDLIDSSTHPPIH
ncbi:hypothetical protein BC939DRAFT_224745 [Gamsiella multidivaricata]|uniref:uncharacterized protein n=1 Tax=Gamsiella multidivaricata TaxID=101098 RepID=UPI00221EFC9F|nr:uncharacterized protein BC939DRAFT_224745 [Gamsiella multidivaricata]KAI7831274.1 hypothetical protein BC939DRAFT_224745 [Gamsiella multidivaricata]